MGRHSLVGPERQFKEARAGLRRLCAAGEAGLRGAEIFGEAWKGARWGGRLVKRLRQAGLVGAVSDGPFYRFVAASALAERIESDEGLTELLWPNAAVPLSYVPRSLFGGQSEAEAEGDDPTPPAAEEAETETEQGEDEGDALSLDKRLDAILQLTGATLQNAAYTREQVTELTAQVRAVVAELAELRKVWT